MNQEQIEYKKLKLSLKGYSKELVSNFIGELLSQNKKATGKLIESIEFQFNDFITEIRVDFLAEDYAKWIELGRKPGTFPPISKIKDWCKVKGIEEKAAYPIAKKIYKAGIKPVPFISDVLKEKNIEQSLSNKIEREAAADVQLYLEELAAKYFNDKN